MTECQPETCTVQKGRPHPTAAVHNKNQEDYGESNVQITKLRVKTQENQSLLPERIV